MILLTEEERNTHRTTIRRIRDKAVRAKEKYCNGDITTKKLKLIEKTVREEEIDYIKTSGVILYYGKLFKGVNHVDA